MSCCRLPCLSDSDSDTNDQDLEHGVRSQEPTRPSGTKRIILTIEGLKCGCCGDSGISRALEQIPGVQNPHVNVVLARVEFDLDIRRMSVGKIRKRLTAATGLAYKQYFQPHGQVLEILVEDPAEIFQVSVEQSDVALPLLGKSQIIREFKTLLVLICLRSSY